MNQEPFVGTVDVAKIQDLDALKHGLHERSRQQAVLHDLGTIAIFGIKFEGAIDPGRRLEQGEISEKDLVNHRQIVEECYVPVYSALAHEYRPTLRCVDGRAKKGYEDQRAEDYLEPLGPQNAGGTNGYAIARAISSFSVGNKVKYDQAYVMAASHTKKLGFEPGSHTGDHCQPGCIDCGAWDKRGLTLAWMASGSDELQGAVETFYEKIGKPFDVAVFSQMVRGAKSLLEESDYFPGIQDFKRLQLDNNPNGIEEKDKVHNEVEVIVNMVPNTTLHTSHLNARTDSKTQSFNDDAWHREDKAQLVPGGEREAYYMAHVAFTLGTKKYIGTESIGLRARLPK
jgi:hypothetical protein